VAVLFVRSFRNEHLGQGLIAQCANYGESRIADERAPRRDGYSV
jgi:hypothetical protein